MILAELHLYPLAISSLLRLVDGATVDDDGASVPPSLTVSDAVCLLTVVSSTSLVLASVASSRISCHIQNNSVIFVNENENGEKRENNEFVNEN